jgi:hypothetical protein
VDDGQTHLSTCVWKEKERKLCCLFFEEVGDISSRTIASAAAVHQP